LAVNAVRSLIGGTVYEVDLVECSGVAAELGDGGLAREVRTMMTLARIVGMIRAA